jgi:hypothetical protein
MSVKVPPISTAGEYVTLTSPGKRLADPRHARTGHSSYRQS